MRGNRGRGTRRGSPAALPAMPLRRAGLPITPAPHRETVARFMAPCAGRSVPCAPLVDALYPALPPPGPDAERGRALPLRGGDRRSRYRRAMELGANGSQPRSQDLHPLRHWALCQGRICANPLTRLVAQETGANGRRDRRPAHSARRSSLCCCATISPNQPRRPRNEVDLVVIGGGLIGSPAPSRRAGPLVVLSART